ncbi:hypothetical protein H2203_002255 [Taxawa tesnikishii (nom. ined.)]|nr:hypothetical protein H2203_002255 [Dothideales sp. JES 119]
MANFLEQLDAQIAELFSSWNLYTTIIAVCLAAFVAYPIIFWEEPDTHPLLLARQSAPSPVRHSGESATYRSPEVPHGYPLKSGLNVKDAGAPRWAGGKDGDIRDIWREVMRGGEGDSPAGMIMTVMGKEGVYEHNLKDVSKEINIIGKHLQQTGGKRVAIYLPNELEYLSAIFACAFYGLSAILIPYNQPQDVVMKLLNDTGADCLIAAAGSLPLEEVCSKVSGIEQVTWVVESTSRHMDWTGAPEEAKGKVRVSVWHELVDDGKAQASSELPSNDESPELGRIVTIWHEKHGGASQIVEFTQKNIVSAVGALSSALPLRQRLSPADLVLPADSFSHSYVLCLTFAALFNHASLAINSVAGPGVELPRVTRSVSPTIIIASAETLANTHTAETAGISSSIQKIAHVSQSQAQSAGRMPTDTLLFKLLAPSGNTPGKLRLIFTSERVGASSPALSSTMLSDLRIFTRSRICYALTAANVAGAVAQTNLFDYRGTDGTQHSHFGVPLSSVEVKLVSKNDAKVDGNLPEGEIVVSGPAVAGGQTKLGVSGSFREDGTLAYA